MGALVRRSCLDFLEILAPTWTRLLSMRIKKMRETDEYVHTTRTLDTWALSEHLGKPEGDKPPKVPVSLGRRWV